MSIWDFGSILVKALNLLAMASVIGGGFGLIFLSNLDARVNRYVVTYMVTGIGVGILGAVIFILLQVGAINQNGMAGALDPQVAKILVQSSLGYSAELRLVGYLIGIVTIVLLILPPREETYGKMARISSSISLGLAILLFGISFPLTGHVAELNLLAKAAIAIHATTALWWVGSLFPLWYACRVTSGTVLAPMMRRFGQLALIIVVILVITGGCLLVKLVESPTEFLTTPYGLSFVGKLIGVVTLLLLATSNKLLLVPSLENSRDVVILQRSIMMEIIVAIGILLITAYFTTVVGLGNGG